MRLWGGRKEPVPKETGQYYVLMVQDLGGRMIEVRRPTDSWSGEDERREQDLQRWLGSLAERHPPKPNSFARTSTDGERGSYIAALGLGVRLGGVVPLAEKQYWETRFSEALRMLLVREQLRASGRNFDLQDFPQAETLIAWLLREGPFSADAQARRDRDRELKSVRPPEK